jgi:hypothetical protein
MGRLVLMIFSFFVFVVAFFRIGGRVNAEAFISMGAGIFLCLMLFSFMDLRRRKGR